MAAPESQLSSQLASQRRLDDAALWAAMRRLLDGLFGVLDRDASLEQGLDVIVEVLGADRGILLLAAEDGSTHVVKARGASLGSGGHPAGSIDASEHEALSRTIVRRAMEEGRAIVWDPLQDMGSSESVAMLGIVAAMAVPLPRFVHSGSSQGANRSPSPRGVVYVDVRDPRKHMGPRHIEFFTTAAPLLGAMLDQSERLRVAQEALLETRAITLDATKPMSLKDLLASPSLRLLREEVESSLLGRSNILVLGESGTGKTLLAHAFAQACGRRPVVRATLGGSDDLNTITSELFGHEKGAFSGATTRRVGLVEHAHGGTLILDEILNLPRHAQQLLLDFTQFGTYRPLGWDKPEPKRADVRILAATNGNLEVAMAQGRFREDLYHRLAGLVLTLPPLRERRQDIAGLAESYLRRSDPQTNLVVSHGVGKSANEWTLSFALRQLLLSPEFDWPGNVRQLERIIERGRERALAKNPGDSVLTPEHVDLRAAAHENEPVVSKQTPSVMDATGSTQLADEPLADAWQGLQAERAVFEQREQALIERALLQHRHVVAHAARELGIARTTLASRLEALGIRGKRS